VGGDEEVGQETDVRLANMLPTNTTITWISLLRTDLVRSDNVTQWGYVLMWKKTLTNLYLAGVGADIIDEPKAKTKDRTADLFISLF